MNKHSSIFVAGARGMVGSAIAQELIESGHEHVLTPGRDELDLSVPEEINAFFRYEKPEYVFLAAARVGGILANDRYPADFLMQNLAIETNVIKAAARHGVVRLLFFGSACAYPKFAEVPIKESALLTGELEPTNRAYAIAKITGIEMCNAFRKQHGRDFISCMPTNLYGPGDHYGLEDSHVLPGMIRKIHNAKKAQDGGVVLWGTGRPTREFLHSTDLAKAAICLMNAEAPPPLANITSGYEIALWNLAEIVAEVIGFEGEIFWDITRPDGTPRRALDGSLMTALGWVPKVGLEAGIKSAYEDFLRREKAGRI